MSARRGAISDKKSSASKRTPRQNTPVSRCRLDTTLAARSNRPLIYQDLGNLTLNPAIFVAPADDFELQCDFAYNEYLQSLLKTQIIEKNVLRFKTFLNDQLSIQTDVLAQQEHQKHELEKTIETHELRSKLDDSFAVLEKCSDEFRTVLNPDVERKLADLIELLERSCNQLSLDNVKAFSPQEYDKFSDLLVTCADTMRKMNNVCGDVERMQTLVDYLNDYYKLNGDVVKAEDSVISLQNDLINSVLKTGSDMFAKFRGYD